MARVHLGPLAIKDRVLVFFFATSARVAPRPTTVTITPNARRRAQLNHKSRRGDGQPPLMQNLKVSHEKLDVDFGLV